MPITSASLNKPASLSSEGDRHSLGIVIGFAGIRRVTMALPGERKRVLRGRNPAEG
jgi:hypothetical protein